MFRKDDRIGNFILLEKIGRGAFGEVWLAFERTNIYEHKVALKLPNASDIDIEQLKKEAILWEEIKGHPNILPIIKADIIDGQFLIASEYASGGSLEEWLTKNDGKSPTFELAIKITKGILSGLEHLHSKKVIHRDLKPGNILLQSDSPRIADFGISRVLKTTASTKNISGTPAYMAPECFRGERSELTDIWSVGIIFHQLLTGKMPFPQTDPESIMYSLFNENPQIDEALPHGLKKVISRSLTKRVPIDEREMGETSAAYRYNSAKAMLEELLAVEHYKVTAASVMDTVPYYIPQTNPQTSKDSNSEKNLETHQGFVSEKNIKTQMYEPDTLPISLPSKPKTSGRKIFLSVLAIVSGLIFVALGVSAAAWLIVKKPWATDSVQTTNSNLQVNTSGNQSTNIGTAESEAKAGVLKSSNSDIKDDEVRIAENSSNTSALKEGKTTAAKPPLVKEKTPFKRTTTKSTPPRTRSDSILQ